MKNILNNVLLICLLVVICLCFAACTDKDTGTVIPTSNEMQINLEEAGYAVTLSNELGGGYSGTHLTAKKENEYIEFYWLDDAEACDYFYNLLDGLYPNSNKLVEMENDGKFGNIVFCGSELAMNASGIKIVEIKVKV
ncbi:MAG: hypothetical protein J1G38_06910 [Clostridiales bacterium]|nr:hypothetical protein [Clostridiales bacterium]